jgi:eukaryotic-like serine/threonine-protein kinase
MAGACDPPQDRLDSWKEIAAYLNRTVRTVYRWQRSAGLPVYRHGGEKGHVYAFKTELDAWLRNGKGDRRETKQRPKAQRWVWIAAKGAAGLLLIAAGVWRWTSGTGRAPALNVIPLTTYPGLECFPSLSRDGNEVAFSWNGPNQDNYDIYVKLISGGPPVRVTTDPAPDTWPALSPDGKLIAFRRNFNVYVVPASGGEDSRVTTGTNPVMPPSIYGRLSWSSDGKWLAFADRDDANAPSGIFLVSVDTGERRRITTPPVDVAPKWGDTQPAFSPDGRRLAFIRGRAATTLALFLLPLAADGHPAGEPKRVTPDTANISAVDWTADGQSVVYCYRDGIARVPVDGRGSPQPILQRTRVYTLSVAPLGGRAVFQEGVMDLGIWRVATDGHAPPTRFIASTWSEMAPEFSPDDKQIVFTSDRTGNQELWTCNSDGADQKQLTSFGGPIVGCARWSPDGRFIAFHSTQGGHQGLYVMAAGGGHPRRLSVVDSSDADPSWSSDSRWIYFRSNRTGRFEIWKMPAGGGQAQQVTRQGGQFPIAAPDGAAVYYVRGNETGIWRVPSGGGNEIRVLEHGQFFDWTLSATGIYLLRRDLKRIEFYPFGSVKPTRTVELPPDTRFASTQSRQMAISRDERWILFTGLDRGESDLMLIENFR